MCSRLSYFRTVFHMYKVHFCLFNVYAYVCWQLSYGKFFATQTSQIENVSTYQVGGEKVFTLNLRYIVQIFCMKTSNWKKNRLSVLWRCWLGGRKGIRPVKTEWWDAGMVVWGEMQICICPADATATHCLLLQSLILRTYLPSVLWHCWLGHLTHENPSPIWPIMCLVGR